MSQFEKFGNIKSKLKKAVAIGTATVALGGAGEAVGTKEAVADALVKNKGNISSVESSQSKANRVKHEKELLEKYKKAKKLVEDINQKIDKEKDPKYRAEKMREELIKHISSREYRNKLRSEFNGNINYAKEEQAERIENLKNVKINVVHLDALNKEYDKRTQGQNIPGGSKKRYGFYDPKYHEIFIPIEQNYGELINLHELLHASTRSDMNIKDSTQDILEDSYKKQGFLGLIKNERDEYFNQPSERLVRKQVLDRELEKLGIKKYGEKFTKEHYKKMMEQYKKGGLSTDAEEFIKRTKPEYFEKIFNEIAKNENGESPNTEQA